MQSLGFPGSSDSKETACNSGDPGLIPGLGGSPGEGNGSERVSACQDASHQRSPGNSTKRSTCGLGKVVRVCGQILKSKCGTALPLILVKH